MPTNHSGPNGTPSEGAARLISNPVYKEGCEDGKAGRVPTSYDEVYYKGYLDGKSQRTMGDPEFSWEACSATG